MLTKSNYIKYLQCKKALWLYKMKPKLMSEVDDSTQRVFDTGYKVESIAYEMFPNGVETANDISQSIKETKELLDKKTPVIFQATVSGGGLFCRSDIITYDDENDVWDIIEVKSSTGVSGVYIDDLSFQKACFESLGYKVGKIFVIHINNKYIKNGKIVPEDFLTKTDVTEKVKVKTKETEKNIQKAFAVLKETKEPNVRVLRQCSNPYKCPFIDYCWKDFSKYSVYSIGGKLGAKKLDELLDEGIEDVADVPDTIIDNEKLLKYRNVVKNDEIYVDKKNIQKELEKIKYPIYFLDYETFGPAIPIFDGYKPFQRIVFQYSLHVQRTADSELEHYEFLAKNITDPTEDLAKSLQSQIGNEGTVVVWYKSFEKGCNNEMRERLEGFTEFFEDVNGRIYDLMDIFAKGYYVHKDFKMSTSIKKVLPVIAPELDYATMDISEGMTASNSWGDTITKDMSEDQKQKIYNDLLKYCELDTFAMVRILEELNKI